MSIFTSLRKIIKVIGILDSLIEQCECEAASKQQSRDRVTKIYEDVADLKGKSK